MSSSNPGLYKKLIAVLTSRERRLAFVFLGLSMIGMMLETLGVGMVIPTVILLTQEDPGSRFPVLQPTLDFLGNPTQTELIVAGMLLLGTIYLVKSAYLGFLTWAQLRFSFSVRRRLSNELFGIYLCQPYTFHLQRNSAYLMRNTQTETLQFVQGTLSPLLVIASEGLLLVGLSILLLFVEPIGAVAVAGIVGTAALAFHVFTRARVTRWGEERREHDGERVKHMYQGFGGVKDLKLMGREAEFLKRYRFHNKEANRAARLQATLNQFPRLVLEFLAVLGLVVLVLSMVAQGRQISTILPILGAFGAAALRILPSVNKIVSAAQAIRFAIPSINSIYDELKLAVPSVPSSSKNRGPGFRSDIRFVDVSFVYEGAERPAVTGLSFTIQKGESIGLIGPSGSGKSTAVDLLLGLLPPSSGQVLVDGRDIFSDIRQWQDQIGYVPQSIYLTDDTLRRNVAFGIPEEEIDDAAVKSAMAAAQLDDFVASLPEGLEWIVGERGARLSGGQRQRIGIARALYHDPSVLVLDEATSALDTETERGVVNSVAALQGNKTIIIVAHRLTTIERCDRLYRLENGRVVEEGMPESMLGNILSSNSLASTTDASS